MFRISLLGPFQVERDGRVIQRQEWARPKDRALLKLLALERGHRIPADRLLDLLWPDLEPFSAGNSLHVSVSRLRKLLGSTLIIREEVGYTLGSAESLWIDVEEFWRQLGEGRERRREEAWVSAAESYRAADALYRGDLFEDDPYEEWAQAPRERLREAHLALLEELADCRTRDGAPSEAIDVCERGLVRDRTREGLYVQLMRAHHAAGHLAVALQVYERCRRALAEDLGVDPGPAAREARARLLRDDAPDVPTVQGNVGALEKGPERKASAGWSAHRHSRQLHLPCVGRERELVDLASRLDAARAGRGQMVLVYGEPGVGKSRLLEEVRRLAERRGVRRLAARCYELERDLPYAPIVEALGSFMLDLADPAEVAPTLGQWGSQLATLIPSLRDLVPGLPRHQPLRPDAERSALLAGLTHLLTGLSRATPLVLLLDDLQWADASTVQWLHYLARRLGGLPVLIVGTYRGNEVGSDHPLQRLLESLAGDPSVIVLRELLCLAEDDIAALLPTVSASAGWGRSLAARLHRETDGHPLFLTETLRTLIETHVLHLGENGEWEETATVVAAPEGRLPLPPNLREAIRWRVARLNEVERRVLVAAAVATRGFRPELLAAMTDLTPGAVLDALESLTGRQLARLSPSGSGFDFRHDLIQEVVYGDLGPDRRRSLHARAAEALHARFESNPMAAREVAGELAHHYLQAEQWQPAFRYAVLAGDHARQSSAPREALANYRRAADVADARPEQIRPSDRVDLLERLGRAHADLGEFDAAIEQFEALRKLARSLDDRLLEGRTLLALADASFFRHAFEPADRLAAEALRRAEDLGNRGLRAGSLVTAASVAIAQGRTEDAQRHCLAVLDLVGEGPAESGDELVVAGARLNALGWLGMLHEFQGDHEQARPAIDASLRLGRDLHNPFLTGRSRFVLAMSLGNQGRYDEALVTLREALRLAEEAGDRYFLPRLLNTIGWVYADLGDPRQAEDWNRRSIAVARETGWLEAEANARVNLGTDALRRGDRATARAELEQAAALVERDDWFTWRYRIRLLVGMGELSLLEGIPQRALAFARDALARAEATNARKHAGRAWLLSARALLAAGGPAEEAMRQVEHAHALARATGNPQLLWASGIELARLHARLRHEADVEALQQDLNASVNAVLGSIQDAALRSSLSRSPLVEAIRNAWPKLRVGSDDR